MREMNIGIKVQRGEFCRNAALKHRLVLQFPVISSTVMEIVR